eukprot:7382421-Prymnesium_polylepis.2
MVLRQNSGALPRCVKLWVRRSTAPARRVVHVHDHISRPRPTPHIPRPCGAGADGQERTQRLPRGQPR